MVEGKGTFVGRATKSYHLCEKQKYWFSLCQVVVFGVVGKGGDRKKKLFYSDSWTVEWTINHMSAWGFTSQIWYSASFDPLSKLPAVRCKLTAYLTESQVLLSWSFSTPKRVHHLFLFQSPDPCPYNFRYAFHVKRANPDYRIKVYSSQKLITQSWGFLNIVLHGARMNYWQHGNVLVATATQSRKVVKTLLKTVVK